jgi:hypothetical protein
MPSAHSSSRRSSVSLTPKKRVGVGMPQNATLVVPAGDGDHGPDVGAGEGVLDVRGSRRRISRSQSSSLSAVARIRRETRQRRNVSGRL